ncbi:TasA family protein [Cellulomonas sp. URHB0016]
MDDLLQEMIDPAPAPRDAPRRRRLWMTVAIVGLAVVGVTRLTTAALFTDNATTGSAIASGTIDLTTDQLTLPVLDGNLMPGDAVVAPVTVTNAGTLSYWYAVTYTATDTDTQTGAGTGADDAHLSDRLVLDVYAGLARCSAPSDTDGATPLATVTDLSTGEDALFGDRALESDAGNRVLGSTQDETLCVKVSFPSTADDNAYQGTATAVSLKFYASQTTHGAQRS